MYYHVAYCKGSAYGKPDTTLIVQMRKDIDTLSPEVWLYRGLRVTTKKHIHEYKAELLRLVNQTYKPAQPFTRIIID